MKINKWISVLFLFNLLLININGQDNKVLIGYINHPQESVDYKTFDPKKFTHIIYSFAHIADNKIVIGDIDLEHLAKFVAFRKSNPDLKVLISIGGWTGDTREFYLMAEKPENRKAFIRSVLEFIHMTKIDGIDIDWEFPGFDWLADGGLGLTPRRPQDKQLLNDLLKELCEALLNESRLDNRKDPYLITITTPAMSQMIQAFDLVTISKYVNYINLMAYDFYMSWLPLPVFFTGHQSNLYDTEDNPRTISADMAVMYHLKAGVPADKLVLGIPFYYNYWTGVNSKKGGLYQFAENNQKLTAVEIRQKINNGTLKRFWDDQAKVPYYWSDKELIFASGDDIESIQYKCEYINNNKLAGAMFWYYQKDTEYLLDALKKGINSLICINQP